VTAFLAALAGTLAIALVLLWARQRRLARRLVAAGHRLVDGVVATGSGLSEATSLVERAIDRTVQQGDDVSLAEERLASALMMIPQGVVVFDADGTIAFRNKVAAGYLTARHGEVLVEEAINELATAVEQEADSAPTRTVELFGPPRRALVLRGIALQQQGRRLGALVVIDDVTDRRRLEAVRRDFVANISHELKTPIGALGLLADTLLTEDDPAVARRLAERMLSEAFRVGRTIDDLLELSRIEADEAARQEDVAVGVVIAEAVDRVRGAAEQQGITIEVEEPSARLAVTGDRRQLVSATYNLLENAVKYSDAGSMVQVRARTDGRYVDIDVEDHGIGIPRRDLERVFERFYRVDRARSRETGGTGLGLAIVRHVANNHAGDVRVTSLEGEGSTFTLRVPIGSGPVAITAEAG
jgi:two-component system, OmpR family, sensor histidine kinase SenX3